MEYRDRKFAIIGQPGLYHEFQSQKERNKRVDTKKNLLAGIISVENWQTGVRMRWAEK